MFAPWRLSALIVLATRLTAQLLPSDATPPGRLVDIGGYRIHLWCLGTKAPPSPTIVLSAGGGDFATDWSLVQRPLSDSARVCSYDRPGYAWSDPGPESRTFRQEAFELHRALEVAGERPPFLVVGHSLGAFVVRRFAEQYPAEVAGVTLVGPTNENGKLGFRGQFVLMRTLASNREIPPVHTIEEKSTRPVVSAAVDSCQSQAARNARITRPYDQLRAQAQRYRLWALGHPACRSFGDDYFAEEMADFYAAWSKSEHPLGNVSLVVILGTRVERPIGLSDAEWRSDSLRVNLSRLSSRGTLVLDSLSGHHVQLDNPAIVTRAILDLLANERAARRPPR